MFVPARGHVCFCTGPHVLGWCVCYLLSYDLGCDDSIGYSYGALAGFASLAIYNRQLLDSTLYLFFVQAFHLRSQLIFRQRVAQSPASASTSPAVPELCGMLGH